MNYKEIISALPEEVADALLIELDHQNFSPDMSEGEVEELLQDAVEVVRLKNLIEDDEERRAVDGLLSLIPKAALKVIFA